MLRYFVLLLCSIVCSLASSAYAFDEFECEKELKPNEQSGILGSVEKRYSAFSDLKAKFIQNSFFAGLAKHSVSKGTVLFKRPGMMDWNYEQPDRQRFVTDGKTLWFYQPDLNQVTLGDFSQSFSSDLPISFLLGVGRLQENFSVGNACYSSEGIVLKLKPMKPDPNLEEFYLLLRKSDRIPIGARIIDVAGNETSITFQEVELEVQLKSQAFTFNIPEGVDIIDKRGAVGDLPRPVIKEEDVVNR